MFHNSTKSKKSLKKKKAASTLTPKAKAPKASAPADKSKPAKKSAGSNDETVKRLHALVKKAGGDDAALQKLVDESSSFEQAHSLALKAQVQKVDWNAAKEVVKQCREAYNATVDVSVKIELHQEPW